MPPTRAGKSQLAKLARAHKPSARGQTPRNEDYVEIIYELIREKGYAKPVDIASHLHEKYGGITLTEKGKSMARSLGQRHALLVAFLKLFGVEETTAQKDTEGLEHYIDSRTLDLLARFVKYVDQNPQWWSQFRKQAKT